MAELNYSAYETVTYEFQGMSDWMKICLGSTSNGIRNQSASIKGTIVFTKQADGTFLVVINETTTGTSVSDTLTDAEVINGNTSYTFFVKAVNSASNFHLGAPTMTEATIPEEPETPVEVRPSFAGSQTILADGTTIAATVGENDVNFAVTNGVDATVALPCIDYTKYQVIMFNWSTSNGWIPFSCVNGDWYFNSGVVYYGTATLTYVNGELKVVMNSSVDGGGVREITITDADIINGKKPLQFYYLGWADGSIAFSDLVMTEVEAPVEPEVPAAPYTFEGAATWAGETKQADASIGEDNVSFNTIMNGVRATLTVAKVDFTKYTTVTFNWSLDDWMMFGYGSDLWFSCTGAAQSGTATMTYADGKITLAMSNGANTYTATITDADVINGKKAFTLSAEGYADYRNARITAFAVAEEAPVEPEVPAAPYTFEGAATWAGETKQADASIGEDNVSFNTIMNGVRATLTVAKVDFTKYTYVTFNWSLDDWMMFGYGSDLWFSCTGAAQSGTATMTYADGVLTLAMSNGTNTHTVTITDADVINGKKAFTLSAEGFADYRNARITSFTVTK